MDTPGRRNNHPTQNIRTQQNPNNNGIPKNSANRSRQRINENTILKMDERVIMYGLAMGMSTWCYHRYLQEVKAHGSKKDLWSFLISQAFTSPRALIDLIVWNIAIIMALPASIIWRLSKWMTKSSKN